MDERGTITPLLHELRRLLQSAQGIPCGNIKPPKRQRRENVSSTRRLPAVLQHGHFHDPPLSAEVQFCPAFGIILPLAYQVIMTKVGPDNVNIVKGRIRW